MIALWVVALTLVGAVGFFVFDVVAFRRELKPAPAKPPVVLHDIDRAWGRAAFPWREEWETDEWPSTRTQSASPSYGSSPQTSGEPRKS